MAPCSTRFRALATENQIRTEDPARRPWQRRDRVLRLRTKASRLPLRC